MTSLPAPVPPVFVIMGGRAVACKCKDKDVVQQVHRDRDRGQGLTAPSAPQPAARRQTAGRAQGLPDIVFYKIIIINTFTFMCVLKARSFSSLTLSTFTFTFYLLQVPGARCYSRSRASRIFFLKYNSHITTLSRAITPLPPPTPHTQSATHARAALMWRRGRALGLGLIECACTYVHACAGAAESLHTCIIHPGVIRLRSFASRVLLPVWLRWDVASSLVLVWRFEDLID